MRVEPLPQPDAAPHIEGECDLVRRRILFGDGERLDEGEEVGDILKPHAREGGVGERRVIVTAVGRHAAHDGVGKIPNRPGTDTVVGIRRDVGCDESAEGGLDRNAARQNRAVARLGARGDMAGGAAAFPEYLFAALGVARRKGCHAPGIKTRRR